jgi:hypothetical protein
MLCKFGCGKDSIFFDKEGIGRCGKTAMYCTMINQKAGRNSGNTRKNNPIIQSEETRKNHSESLKRAYDEGRRKSSNYAHKIKESNKKQWADNPREPWNKGVKTGQVVWNKGKIYSLKPYTPKGSNDPLYKEFVKYRYQVQKVTRLTYARFKYLLNPNNLFIGLAGNQNAHHVDHVVSTRFAFENKVPPNIIGSLQNLQVIPWKENIRKYGGTKTRANKNSDQQQLLDDLLSTQNLV